MVWRRLWGQTSDGMEGLKVESRGETRRPSPPWWPWGPWGTSAPSSAAPWRWSTPYLWETSGQNLRMSVIPPIHTPFSLKPAVIPPSSWPPPHPRCGHILLLPAGGSWAGRTSARLESAPHWECQGRPLLVRSARRLWRRGRRRAESPLSFLLVQKRKYEKIEKEETFLEILRKPQHTKMNVLFLFVCFVGKASLKKISTKTF